MAQLLDQDARQTLVSRANQVHVEFLRLGKAALERALRVGEQLIEARNYFEDQDAAAWAPREFGLSGHEAEILMSFAARNSELGKALSPANHLGVTELIRFFARLTGIQAAGGEETSHAAAMCEDAAGESASIAPATANGQASCGETAREGHVENEPVRTDTEEPAAIHLSKSQWAARAVLELEQEGAPQANGPANAPGLFVAEARRLRQQDPELFAAVLSGKLTLPQAKRKAEKRATLPQEKT